MQRSTSPGMATAFDQQPGSSSGQAPEPQTRRPAGRRPPDEAEEEMEGQQRRGGRTTIQRGAEDIPVIKDQTGERVKESFIAFLESFVKDPAAGPSSTASGEDPSDQTPYYINQVHAMKDFELTTLYVDFSHLMEREQVLAKAIADQYYRFLPYLRLAIQELVKKYERDYLYTNAHLSSSVSSGLQTREFSIAFYNLPIVSGIRDLRTERIGQLTSISGTVTRTSEVRPELVFGSFICQECRTTVKDVEQQFKYTEPTMCPNLTCNNRGAWRLSIEQSKFSDWQKVRIQENANEIPTGSIPRSLDVILRSEIVERAKAGDKCVFTGTFIVVPDVAQMGLPGVNAEMMRDSAGGRQGGGLGDNFGVSGLKALGVRDLTYKTAFLACMVQSADSRAGSTNVRSEDEGAEASREEFLHSLTAQEVDELKEMVHNEHIYSRLVQSIAPTVYGHEIVKKGILLQLMGGVHKKSKDGMHLRGDINVCVVGDPSTSKSQFLKYVCGFLPRAVYTSGKASSAAGLTAAVVKDEETGEFTIEAGALMLADNGICAIDEFDKMDIADQVAIHEAMEQQTISIAKAGIQATLNARTSILAAANPIGGRYNRKISLRQNVAMSAPIMSRFDLFFVVLDECNPTTDLSIAQHIVNVHRFQNAAINPEFSTDALQRYIRYARTFNPKLTPAASAVLVEKYCQLRQDDATGFGRNSYRITVRQLESMVRLSEAIARANCMQEITPAFVREAYSLLKQSIIHVEKDDVEMDDEEDNENGDDDQGPDGMNQDHRPSDLPSSPTRKPAAEPEAAAPRKKVVVSYDKYMSIATLLNTYLSEQERLTGTGVSRYELKQWYLEQREEDLNTMEELQEEQVLIDKVMKKLVKEKQLLELRGEIEEGDDAGEEQGIDPEQEDSKIILMVHPDAE